MQRHLQDAVTLFAEEPVRFFDVLEREVMGHQWRQVHASALDHRHQTPHALLATWTECRNDALVTEAGIQRFVRRDELAGIDAEARQRSTGPGRAQRVLER